MVHRRYGYIAVLYNNAWLIFSGSYLNKKLLQVLLKLFGVSSDGNRADVCRETIQDSLNHSHPSKSSKNTLTLTLQLIIQLFKVILQLESPTVFNECSAKA